MPYTPQGLPFAVGSHTSQKAAAAAAQRRGPKTARYLRLLSERGAQTDHEAAGALSLPLSSICSIRNSAVDCGLVVRGVAERPSPYGKACSTWQLTEAGEAAVRAMREAAA
jgi:hypothetical protein